MKFESDEIVSQAEASLKRDLIFQMENKLGVRNIVITVHDGQKDLVIKAGLDTETDLLALQLLDKINFAAPKVEIHTNFVDDNISFGLIVMSKLNGEKIRYLSEDKRPHLVSQIIDELVKLKLCKSENGAGPLTEVHAGMGTAWKEYLETITNQAVLDLQASLTPDITEVAWNTISRAIKIINSGIEDLPEDLFICLLHNDLNLANCLASDDKFTGIVDWSDAIYGDWLYDLSRLRMNLAQSKDEPSLKIFEQKLKMNSEEKGREQLYYLCRLVEYLGIYRKYGNDFWFNRNLELLVEEIGCQA